jgi:hypothetical protein
MMQLTCFFASPPKGAVRVLRTDLHASTPRGVLSGGKAQTGWHFAAFLGGIHRALKAIRLA